MEVGHLSSNIRGNGLTLHQRRFRFDIRKNFSTEMVIRHWKRLETPSLEAYKWFVAMALGDII